MAWEQPERIAQLRCYKIAVVMEKRRVTQGRWRTEHWQALGVVVDHGEPTRWDAALPIHRNEGTEQYLRRGFSLELHRDEAESYYYNLLSAHPSVFVICREDPATGRVEPVLTRVSHYEAQAYLEAGDEVHAVSMPPDIYRWVERFVVDNYQPEVKKARKRENWHD